MKGFKESEANIKDKNKKKKTVNNNQSLFENAIIFQKKR